LKKKESKPIEENIEEKDNQEKRENEGKNIKIKEG